MNRRSFLSTLALLPGLGWLKPKAETGVLEFTEPQIVTAPTALWPLPLRECENCRAHVLPSETQCPHCKTIAPRYFAGEGDREVTRDEFYRLYPDAPELGRTLMLEASARVRLGNGTRPAAGTPIASDVLSG